MGGSDASTSTSSTTDNSALTILGDVGHVLTSAVFDPSELAGALKELDVDTGTIAKILDALGTGEDQTPRMLNSLAHSNFGNLPKGIEMATETAKAHAFLQQSVKDLLKDLGLYIEAVRAFQHGTTTTDQYAADDLKRIQNVVDQAAVTHDRQRHRRG